MTKPKSKSAAKLVWLAVVVLFVLHQDFWWWNDGALVFGFLPVSLCYHAAFSLAAGLIWALANKFAWPEDIEVWAAEGDENTSKEGDKR